MLRAIPGAAPATLPAPAAMLHPRQAKEDLPAALSKYERKVKHAVRSTKSQPPKFKQGPNKKLQNTNRDHLDSASKQESFFSRL